MKYEENSGIAILYLRRGKKKHKEKESAYYSFVTEDARGVIGKIMKKHNVNNYNFSNVAEGVKCYYSNRRQKERVNQAFKELSGKKVKKMIIRSLFARGKNVKAIEFVKYNTFFSPDPEND